mmetsp:Transcript_8197/g.20630  ORF Transcript_8197/g.20630 Transcript_8197/m.20630 type:complete len:215 (+) Transcript_8197:409-1053(+)
MGLAADVPLRHPARPAQGAYQRLADGPRHKSPGIRVVGRLHSHVGHGDDEDKKNVQGPQKGHILVSLLHGFPLFAHRWPSPGGSRVEPVRRAHAYLPAKGPYARPLRSFGRSWYATDCVGRRYRNIPPLGHAELPVRAVLRGQRQLERFEHVLHHPDAQEASSWRFSHHAVRLHGRVGRRERHGQRGRHRRVVQPERRHFLHGEQQERQNLGRW